MWIYVKKLHLLLWRTHKDRRSGWKPIPSEARVTWDEVSGFIEHIVTAVWKTVPPNERSIRVNPINPCLKKLSGETNSDCICAYTGLDSLQQEIIRDNHCARQAQTNPARHNKNPWKNRSVASALSVIDFERGERAKGEWAHQQNQPDNASCLAELLFSCLVV